MKKRMLYFLLGNGAGLLIVLLVRGSLGERFSAGIFLFSFACGMVALAIAERKGKAPTVDEVHKMTTLGSDLKGPEDRG